jgi:hypothetical protein
MTIASSDHFLRQLIMSSLNVMNFNKSRTYVTIKPLAQAQYTQKHVHLSVFPKQMLPTHQLRANVPHPHKKQLANLQL